MIATRTTPALAPANDTEAVTVSPTTATSTGTATLHPRKLGLLISSLPSLSSCPLVRRGAILSVSHIDLKYSRGRVPVPSTSGARGRLIGSSQWAAAARKLRHSPIPGAHQARG